LFAGFAGAGEEVEGEEFHFLAFGPGGVLAGGLWWNGFVGLAWSKGRVVRIEVCFGFATKGLYGWQFG
jgi:hypothetical protein